MSLAKLIGGHFPANKSEGGYRRRINRHRRIFTTQQQKYFTACAYACAAILTGAEPNNSTDIGSETLAVSQSCNFLFIFILFIYFCLQRQEDVYLQCKLFHVMCSLLSPGGVFAAFSLRL